MHGNPHRPKIVFSGGGSGLVSHAGSRLLAELADRAGFTGLFGDVLAGLRERRSGHDPGRVLVDLAVMLADGGTTISDLAVLRNQPELFGPVASTATAAWRVLDRVDDRLVAGLRSARATARERVWLQAADTGRLATSTTAGGRVWPGIGGPARRHAGHRPQRQGICCGHVQGRLRLPSVDGLVRQHRRGARHPARWASYGETTWAGPGRPANGAAVVAPKQTPRLEKSMIRSSVTFAAALSALAVAGCATSSPRSGSPMTAGARPSAGGPTGTGMMGGGGSAYDYSRLTCSAPASLPGRTVNVTLADMGMTRMMGGTAPRGVQMRLRAEPATAPAGQVSLVAPNLGWRTHELVILPLAAGAAAGQRTPGPDGKIDEAGKLGESSRSCAAGSGDGITAGTVGWTTLTLPRGRYELVCNLANHYADGMRQELVIT